MQTVMTIDTIMPTTTRAKMTASQVGMPPISEDPTPSKSANETVILKEKWLDFEVRFVNAQTFLSQIGSEASEKFVYFDRSRGSGRCEVEQSDN